VSACLVSCGLQPVFLIGAQKAGTSYLFRLLVQDAGIAHAKQKEPKFFSKPCFDAVDFFTVFDAKDGQSHVLDASASYLHVSGTAEKIAEHVGTDVSVLAVLRDPIERAVSGYLHEVKHGRELRVANDVFDLETDSIASAVDSEARRIAWDHHKGLIQPHDTLETRYREPLFQFAYVSNSLYARQLQSWIRIFPKLRLIDFASLCANPVGMVERVRAEIGLSPQFIPCTDVARNKTRLSWLRAIRGNRALCYDYTRPSLPFAGVRLARIIMQKSEVKRAIPTALAKLLQDDYQSLRDRMQGIWL
jgi:hypothetical protein